MRKYIRTQSIPLGAFFAGMILLAGPSARAVDITQTVTHAAGSNWTVSASWGTPALVAMPGTNYISPAGFVVRTVDNNNTPFPFPGDKLTLNGSSLFMKNGNGAATVNLVLNPGTVQANTFNATGTPALTNGVLAGTLEVLSDSTIKSAGSGLMSIWLQSAVSGSGHLTLAMGTNTLFLSGSNAGFSGNWTNTSGGLSTRTGTTNAFGSGVISLQQNTYPLTFNSADDMVVNNLIEGIGSVRKQGGDSVILTANNTFTGGLTAQAGTLVLPGSGAQATTAIQSNAVLRLANSAALPNPSVLTISPNNTQTGRLELSNSITLATGSAISVAMRTGPTVAVESISGNNIISDQISIFSGGTTPIGIQADAGATLTLNGGITSGVTGTRGALLGGAGNGSVAGVIDNGLATTVSLTKDGTGTWTLGNANSYTGNTVVSNGVLKVGASGSIASSAVIDVNGSGKLDATSVAGGLLLSSTQTLRGNGAVLGDVTTSGNSAIEIALTNQYGSLALSNSLTLAGGDTLRFDIGLTTNDVLNITSKLTNNGVTTIEIKTPAGFANTGTYRLINYSGTVQGGGSFNLVAPASRQSFALDTATAGQVNLTITGNPTNLVWAGDGSANLWDVGTTANWNTQVYYQADNVTFNDAGSATPDINVVAPVSPGSVTVSNTLQSYTFTNAGVTTAYPLVKRGGNVLALAADGNGFSGPISIEAGTLSIGNGGETGSLGTGSITNNGQLLLNKSTNGAFLPGNISGTGTVHLKGGVNGGGALMLAGTNSYAGVTTIETNCQLNLNNNSALGSPSAGTVVQAGGRVGFISLGNWTVDEPLTLSGYGVAVAPGALYANQANNIVTLTAPVSLTGDTQIRLAAAGVKMTLTNTVIGSQTALQCSPEGTGTVLTFQNTLSLGNLATLTKDGTGVAILGGNSNLCGSIVVNGGTLQVGDGGANGALTTGAIDLAGAGSTLIFNSGNDFVRSEAISGIGALLKRGSGTLTMTSNTFTGAINHQAGTMFMTGSGTQASTLIESNAVLRVSHSLAQQSGVMRVNSFDSQTGRLELSNNITIPAGVSIELGMRTTATVALENVSGNNSITDPVVISTGGALPARIQVDAGTTLTLLGGVTFSPSSAAQFRGFGLQGAGTGVVVGAIANGTAPALSLLKDDAGTWTLEGANSYTGDTTIQGGTLVLGASATITTTPNITLLSNAVLNVSAISGGLTLDASQTLKGNGTVQGSVNANGTVRPGTSVGSLMVTTNLGLAGFTVMELNRTNTPLNADLITAGALTFGGELTVTNIGPDLQGGDAFNLFDGPITGTFTLTNLPALSSTNLSWDVSLLGSQGIISVVSSVTPPPTTPVILSPARSGTNVTFQVLSQLGYSYVVEATPILNPAAWTAIETNAGTGGTLNFTIPITPANPKRFFRIGAY